MEHLDVLVLCSAEGDIALWLAERLKSGTVTGLELDGQLRDLARKRANERGVEKIVRFEKADRSRIWFANESFDLVVSEFVLFPTPNPTEIGQREMVRVLRHGGTIALTDIITTKPLPEAVRRELNAIGLDYLCDRTMDDFRHWMSDVGLVDVSVMDYTPIVRKVWENRKISSVPERGTPYRILLDDSEFQLGHSIFYIYVRGRKL